MNFGILVNLPLPNVRQIPYLPALILSVYNPPSILTLGWLKDSFPS